MDNQITINRRWKIDSDIIGSQFDFNEKSQKKYKALNDEQRNSMWETLDKAATKNEKTFEKKMQDFFEGQLKRVLKSIPKTTKAIEDEILDWDEENALLFAELKPEWKKSFLEGAMTVNELYEFAITEMQINPRFLDWMKEYGLDQAKGINGTTQDSLRKSLTEGIDAGESIPELSKRVKDIYNVATTSRANMIARTETHNSVSAGTFETYKEAELEQKEWLATSDSRTRHTHIDINREVVDIDKKFSNGLMYPGDHNGSASEVVNCRCTLLPVIPD